MNFAGYLRGEVPRKLKNRKLTLRAGSDICGRRLDRHSVLSIEGPKSGWIGQYPR
jgi:hypothetical protein